MGKKDSQSSTLFFYPKDDSTFHNGPKLRDGGSIQLARINSRYLRFRC